MKHLLLAISLFLFLMPKQGTAQIQKGSSTISSLVDSKFSSNNSYGAVSANYTRFVNPHLGIGAGVSTSITNFAAASSYSLNFGATAMYVLNPSSKAPFYAGLGATAGTNTATILNGQNFRTSLFLSNLAIGNLFFLNKNVALNSAISWNNVFARNNGIDFNKSSINAALSLTPFLTGGLRDEIALEEGESLFAANRVTVKGYIGYYDIATEFPDSVSHIRKNLEASFFLMKGLEIGAGLTDNYLSPFAAFYLPMQNRVGILAEVQYQKVINKKSLENSTWIPSLGAAYFLNKNIAIVGKASYYPSKLSAFNATGFSLNLKYFLK